VTLTTDTVLTVGGYNLTVSGSSALLQSIEVGSSDFSITIATGSAMTVTSADRKVFTVDGVTSAYVTQSCSDSVSTLTITVPSGSEAVPTALIIPTATVCSTASAGSNISSGSSPGGFGSPAPVAVTAPVVIPAVILATVPGCPAGVTCTPIPSAFSASVVLTSDLSRGTEGSDVETLQKFLARFSEIYPEGIANGFFGPATERAVKRFQAKYGISQVGRVGPATRAKIVEVSATGGAVPATRCRAAAGWCTTRPTRAASTCSWDPDMTFPPAGGAARRDPQQSLPGRPGQRAGDFGFQAGTGRVT